MDTQIKEVSDKLDLVLDQNNYMLGLLESNPKTGQMGVVEQSNNNKKRIDDIETNGKIRMGLAVVLGFIGGNTINIIKLVKLLF